jgi:hypothetical protein
MQQHLSISLFLSLSLSLSLSPVSCRPPARAAGLTLLRAKSTAMRSERRETKPTISHLHSVNDVGAAAI